MSDTITFDAGHEAAIHDAKFDYYGRFLATASTDGKVKIFEILPKEKTPKEICDLKEHEGPVWQVSWSHPKFGVYLASCGYRCKVIVWKRGTNNEFTEVYQYSEHQSSVNAVEFHPVSELMLLVGACDGISIHNMTTSGAFACTATLSAHLGGVNAVSWSVQTKVVTNPDGGQPESILRFASGGCDNQIIIWKRGREGWKRENELVEDGHTDWVRGVAWAPALSPSSDPIIASCSEDKTVKIWKEQCDAWSVQQTITLEDKVWSVSFSQAGNILAVSDTKKVHLYRESKDGTFQLCQ